MPQKKKVALIVRPKKVADRFERKRLIVDIPKKRAAKIPKRIGFINSKKAETANLAISKKVKEEQNNVTEEGVVDDINVDNASSFTENIPVYQIFEIESDDKEVDEKPPPRSALTYGDLKLMSNNRMLSNTIINAAQNIIHLQYPSIAGLQDTLLGQSFHSKDAKDQQSFHFKELPDQPFVQVLHDGDMHWLAISTINYLPDEAFIMDSMFRRKINHHVQRQICSIMHCSMDTIKAMVLRLQQQTNGIDCGLYVLAFIVYLLENDKYPTEVSFNQNQMRNHLLAV